MPVTVVNATAGQCFDAARLLLNDNGIPTQLWTDQNLMPMMYKAHLELQAKLKQRAAPVMKAFIDIVLSPNYTTIPPNILPDLTSPIQIWEKSLGAPMSNYTPMTEADVLPFQLSTGNAQLVWWSFAGEVLTFIGTSIGTELLIYYWRRLPIPTASADMIGVIDGEQFLGPRIAAIAASSVGEETTAMAAQALAESQLQVVLAANRSRAPQAIGGSPHP